MTQDLERYLIRLDATTEGLRRELRAADSAVANTAKNVDRHADRIAGAFDGVSKAVAQTKTLIGGLAVGAAVRQIASYSDEWTDLSGRVRVATGSIEQSGVVMGRLSEMARRTYTALGQTADTYLENATAMRELGYSTQETLDWVETVNNALVASGAKAQRAESVMRALSNAMALGTLSGENLNTVLKSGGQIAEALAENMGVSTLELRALGTAGKITREDIVGLSSQLEVMRAKADSMAATVGDAWGQLNNAVMRYVGNSDSVSAGTGALASAILTLADNIEVLGDGVQVAAIALGTYYVPAAITAASTTIASTAAYVGANIALGHMAGYSTAAAAGLMTLAGASRALMAAGPYAVIAAAAYALYELADGNDAAADAEQRYARELSVTTELQHEYMNASSQRRDEIRQHIVDNIASYEAERQMFVNMMQDYLQMSKIRLGAEELLGRARNDILAPLGIVQTRMTPGQVAAGLKGTTRNIEELQKVLENLGKTSGKGSIGNVSKEMENLAKKQREWSETLEVSLEQAKRLNDASMVSAEAYEAVAVQIEVENELRKQGIHLGSQQYELRRAELTQLKSYEAQTKKNLEAIRDAQSKQKEMASELAREFAQPFENAARNIQNTMADTFEGVFDGSIASADDAAGAIKRIFRRLAAEMAALAIFRPSVIFSGGVSGGLDAIFSGASSVSGASVSGGGAGIGNLSSIGSFLANGTLYSNTLAGIGGGIGNILSGQSWGAMGPSYGSAIGSGAFGNLGYGAIGGGLASLLGLGHQNMLVNMAASTLGTLAGGAIGTSMGTILGFAGGPIGAIAGGFLGSALGGLFGGGKPSDKAQWGAIDLSTFERRGTGGQGGSKYSQENADFRDAVLAEAENLAKMLQAVGGKSSGEVYLHIGSRDGLRIGGAGGTNYGNNAEAFIEAVMREVVNNTSGLSDRSLNIINMLGLDDLQELAEGLQFGQILDNFGKVEESISETGAALQALNDAFDQYRTTAEKLGLSITDLNLIEEERQRKLIELRDGYDTQILNAVRQIVDPLGVAIDNEIARYEQQMKDAETLGANTGMVDTLHQLQMYSLYSQQADSAANVLSQFARLSEQLQSTKNSLSVGSLSINSPLAQYEEMAARFADIGARSQLGDMVAMGELSSISREFLQMSQQMYGSTAAYVEDYNRVMGVIDLAKDTSDRQVAIQQEIVDAQKEMNEQLKDIVAILTAGGELQSDQLGQINDNLGVLNDRISRLAS